MSLYAVLADIHGNYQALQAVEADARSLCKNGDLRFICLGDVVDYGPQPNKCVEWLRDQAQAVVALVQGNHERAVMLPHDQDLIYSGIDWEYWPITLWTRRELKEAHREWIRAEWQERQFLTDEVMLFHGTPSWDSGCIDDPTSAADVLAKMPKNVRYGLFGHTHVQGYFLESFDGATMHLTGGDSAAPHNWEPAPLDKWITLPVRHQRVLLNPGSVGQPRHPKAFVGAGVTHDWRASYMLLSMNGGPPKVRFQRVEYDVDKTIQLLRRIHWSHKSEDRRRADITRGNDPLPSDNWLVKRYREVRDQPELLRLLVEMLVKTLRPEK